MPFVITEPCIGCQDQSCVAVCPVDAIHLGIAYQDGNTYDQFFINAAACICCSLCEPECPVDAIFEEDEVPTQWSHFIRLNADFYRQEKPPLIPNNGV